MTRDLVIVVPGILGSSLAKDGDPVWEPSTAGVLHAIRTFARSLDGLTLPEGVGDDHPGDGVVPTGLIEGFHLLPGLSFGSFGYGKLMAGLRQRRFGLAPAGGGRPGNLVAFSYDWRLSNRYTAARLKAVAEEALGRWRASDPARADARVVFVCHSMGGLVARWYVEQLGGAEVTRAVVTLGTPHRGSLNALTELVNGTQKGVAFVKKDLSPLVRSLPSMYQLLPQYACVEQPGRPLAKLAEVDGLALPTKRVGDGAAFLDALMSSGIKPAHAATLHPLVGIAQPTATTARLVGDRVQPVRTIDGRDDGGDATVPRLSASAPGQPTIAPVNGPIVESHGALPRHPAVLDVIEGALTGREVIHRSVEPDEQLGVEVEPVVPAGSQVTVKATGGACDGRQLVAVAYDEAGREQDRATAVARDGGHEATFDELASGAYRVEVSSVGPAGGDPAVNAPVLVWDEA